MHGIYLGASVVLSAARATDPAKGFLQNRRLDEIYNTVFELRAEVQGNGTHTFFLHESTDNSEDDPIDQRAWALQEHRLAIKLLRFGSKQTRWGCKEEDPDVDGGCDPVDCFVPETDPDSFNGELSGRLLEDDEKVRVPLQGEWSFDGWMHVVEKYSSRKLTRPSDKLPALAALAHMFAIENLSAPSYCAGLWADDLAMQLLWKAVSFDNEKAESMENSNPSWSWASIGGSIEYPLGPPYTRTYIILKDIDCQIVLKDQNLPFGEVQSAKLTLECKLREAIWDGCSLYTLLGIGHDTGHQKLTHAFDKPTNRLPGPVWLLHVYSDLAHVYGLILETEERSSVFKRVGYFEADLDSLGENRKQIYDKRKITII